MTTPKQRADRLVTAAMVLTDLTSSAVAMRSIEHAGVNTPVRDDYALAEEHAAAALSGIRALRSEAQAKSRRVHAANRRRKA